ncbi:hypothetical protein E4634_03055 [Mangrovimicrobium sediminis]|uniref:DUF5329 domain-containing protein n=1 Tax=Mangrovimicrobium sediminis TaxID=2562682 RepID=A0A4Z0M7Q0_9GAMM|nr:DUF5329 domain-containing protein [Haliea sp. SAOS-164]TGD75440.1 hypothetical protein E4634_03055 [Haliea sp. SAOS-164]
MPRLLTLILLLALSTPSLAGSNPEREIQQLIDFVAASGCVFHRNGSDYSAEAAAEHLQLKYRRGRKYADTAEHFIDRLASASSFSGKPYTVTCAGETQTASQWLHRELLDQRGSPQS